MPNERRERSQLPNHQRPRVQLIAASTALLVACWPAASTSFAQPPRPLNDTGITWGAAYPAGNNATCTSNISGAQDCHAGRDVTHNDDSDSHAGFSFTKLDASGIELPVSAPSWACVRDNVTGLTWEVKQDDPASIHDWEHRYRWGGRTALGTGYGTYYDDWDSLVIGSNNLGLCGRNNWRVPDVRELEGLANLGADGYTTMDTNYFPWGYGRYWSANPAAANLPPELVDSWWVSANFGDSGTSSRDEEERVRLVSSAP